MILAVPGKVLRLNVGDVFRLPIDAETVGYGQIADRYGESAYYFAIFEQPYEVGAEPEVADIVRGRIALLALSLDALLFHGVWMIVGSAAVPQIDWPTYKVAVAPDVWQAEDHTGTTRRPLERSEAHDLPFRALVAPMRIQKALGALHGIGEWNGAYDKLRYRPGDS